MKKNPYKTILRITTILYYRLTHVSYYSANEIKDVIKDFEELKDTILEKIVTELRNFKPEEINELEEKKSILEYIEIIDRIVNKLNKIPSFW